MAGYRSFGSDLQRFSNFSRINILIGQNNSGKSNVLRFIHDWLARAGSNGSPARDAHDRHFPSGTPLKYGFRLSCARDGKLVPDALGTLSPAYSEAQKYRALKVIFEAKMRLDQDPNGPWFHFDEKGTFLEKEWETTSKEVSDGDLNSLWNHLTNQSGGSRQAHWGPETIRRLAPSRPQFECHLVPAIRTIGAQGSQSEGFSGDGIIERLAKLQNPPALGQRDKDRFNKIGDFLRTVTDNPTAGIEIPYERNTILVHMDGKTLPLESLGSGIHEVIILAAAATLLENCVVCMEEPELHLNPILQKKLVRYLHEATSNQYFISSHSAALMDTPDAEVYHVTLNGGASRVERVTSDRHRSEICEDLGYHPSDLLQTNCVIWVEGPSDRIYLNWWINSVNSQLIEGIHYSIMFYGGRLASHLSGHDLEPLVADFISLRRLNRRGVILIDSDRSKRGMRINDTKSRLRDEFDSGPGHAWITEGREIENYLDPLLLMKAISAVHPSAAAGPSPTKYENALLVKNRRGEKLVASKVKIANKMVAFGKPDTSLYDLRPQVLRLVQFIVQSNPGIAMPT